MMTRDKPPFALDQAAPLIIPLSNSRPKEGHFPIPESGFRLLTYVEAR